MIFVCAQQSVNISGMSGGVFRLPSGIYAGGKITACSNITIDVSAATVTKNIDLSGLTNVILTGGIFKGSGYNISTPCKGLRVYYATGIVTPALVTCNFSLPFTGSNFALQNFTIANNTMKGGGTLFRGNYGHAYDMNCFYDSGAIFNNHYDSTNGEDQFIAAGGFLRFDIYGNYTKYNVIWNTGGDWAVYNINGGYGRLHDNYRSGGWGWLDRIFTVSTKEGDTTYVYGNIDLNTSHFGSNEIRTDGREWTVAGQGVTRIAPLTGTHIVVVNNTGGNHDPQKLNGYENCVVYLMNCVPPYTSKIQNNVGFNNGAPGQQDCIRWNQYAPTIISNNKYYKTYQDAGFVDDVNCNLVSNSPLIDAGTQTIAKNDFAGIPRPQGKAYDIGARESGSGTIPPVDPCKNCPCPTCTPINATTCAPFFPPCPPVNATTCQPFFPPIPPQRKPVKITIVYDDGSQTTSTLQ